MISALMFQLTNVTLKRFKIVANILCHVRWIEIIFCLNLNNPRHCTKLHFFYNCQTVSKDLLSICL